MSTVNEGELWHFCLWDGTYLRALKENKERDGGGGAEKQKRGTGHTDIYVLYIYIYGCQRGSKD